MRHSGILSRSMSAESISGLYSCMTKVLIARRYSLEVACNPAVADWVKVADVQEDSASNAKTLQHCIKVQLCPHCMP